MPAVLIPAAHGGMLMEEELAAVRVSPDNGRVVQRCESVAVLVIRGGPKLQEGLGEEFKVVTGSHTWKELKIQVNRFPSGQA